MFTSVDLYSYFYVSERKWTLADPLSAVVLDIVFITPTLKSSRTQFLRVYRGWKKDSVLQVHPKSTFFFLIFQDYDIR